MKKGSRRKCKIWIFFKGCRSCSGPCATAARWVRPTDALRFGHRTAQALCGLGFYLSQPHSALRRAGAPAFIESDRQTDKHIKYTEPDTDDTTPTPIPSQREAYAVYTLHLDNTFPYPRRSSSRSHLARIRCSSPSSATWSVTHSPSYRLRHRSNPPHRESLTTHHVGPRVWRLVPCVFLEFSIFPLLVSQMLEFAFHSLDGFHPFSALQSEWLAGVFFSCGQCLDDPQRRREVSHSRCLF
jgi:hypothetical protein